jgi:hypothetical protein
MKIRTLEQLRNSLQDDLIWRRNELEACKQLIKTHKNSDSAEFYLRSGVVMLYAHWEGFVLEASCLYVEYVSRQKLTLEELAPNFIALGLKGTMKEAVNNKDAALYNEVIEILRFKLRQRSTLPTQQNDVRDVLRERKRNMKADVLENLLVSLGLPYRPEYQVQAQLIDNRLVYLRNAIAHGRKPYLEQDTVLELFEKIEPLFTLFKNQIENAAATERYKHQLLAHHQV